jgi:hypothetical protein
MVTMSQKEFQRVKVIENAVGARLSVREASGLLQLSERQVDRARFGSEILTITAYPRPRQRVSACGRKPGPYLQIEASGLGLGRHWNVRGTLIIRETVTLDADGDSYQGTFVFDFYDRSPVC